MIIRELVTKFGFDVDEAALKAADEGVEAIKKGLFGIAVTAGAATAALFAMVVTAARSADELNKTALAAGVSTEILQTMGYAAAQSGSNVEELGTSLRFLSRNIADAAKDKFGQTAQTFKKLGISVTDVNGRLKTSDQVFLELSGAYQKIQDPARKTAIAMDLLGRSGGNMIEMLNAGPKQIALLTAEAEAFGVMSEGNIEVLKRFNDSLESLFWVFGQIRNFIASEVAPALTDMIDQVREWFLANKDIIKSNLLAFFKALAWYLKAVFTFGMRLLDMFTSLAKHIGGVEIVTKLLLVAITALSAASVIGGLMLLAPIFLAIGKAALLAIAPFALVALKIIAIGAAIFLVVEDLYSFFTGGDSVTGVIVQAFVDAWGWIKKTFVDGMAWLHTTLKGWADYFTKWFTNFTAPFVSFMTMIGNGLSGLVNGNTNSGSTSGGVPSLTGITPSSAPVNPVGGAGNNMTVSAPISVVVPPGTDPGMVGERVETGLQLGIGDLFRQTNRVTSSGVAY